jgi:hypothetical protein
VYEWHEDFTEAGFSAVKKLGTTATRDKTDEQGEQVQGNRNIAPAEKLQGRN